MTKWRLDSIEDRLDRIEKELGIQETSQEWEDAIQAAITALREGHSGREHRDVNADWVESMLDGTKEGG